jgi:hypothetical protein
VLQNRDTGPGIALALRLYLFYLKPCLYRLLALGWPAAADSRWCLGTAAVAASCQ